MPEVDAQARVARDSLAGLLYPTPTVRATFEGELATIVAATNQPRAGAVAATPEPTPSVPIPASATPEPAAVATARAEQGAVSTPCSFDIPGGFREGKHLECFYVTVPENRAAPEHGTLRLLVVRFKSRAPQAAEPLFYLSGGPGGSGVKEGLGLLSAVLAPFLSARDVILIDQRGTGRSQPSMSCGEAYDLRIEFSGRRKKTDARITKYYDALRECARRLQEDGRDFSAYNTVENAADIDAVRRALGYKKFLAWGASYGATLGLTLMRNHGDHLSGVILEAVAPPQINLLKERAFAVDHALGTLFEGCRSDAVCNDRYPNLEQDLYKTVDRLNKRPIDVPGLQAGAMVKIDGGDLVDLLIASLYSSEMLPYLPKMIANMNSGDYRALARVYQFADFTGDSIAAGMHFAVMCAEEAAHTSAAEVRAGFESRSQLSSIFASNGYDDLFDLCKRWGTIAVADAQLEPVTSSIPTLVLNGKYDPVTPAVWGDLAAATLSNSYVFTFDGAGHGVAVAGQRCALSLVRAFVKNPAARPDEKCVTTVKPLKFFVD